MTATLFVPVWGDPILPPSYWRYVFPCPVTGCWWWAGAQRRTRSRLASGVLYGTWAVPGVRKGEPGRQRAPHVVMCEAVHGPRPEGEFALHACDQGLCVNPEHLRWGTHAENTADKLARDRQPRGVRVRTAVLTDGQVLAIRTKYAGGASPAALGDDYGVNRSTIYRIVTGQGWTHVGGPIGAARLSNRKAS